MRAAAQWGGELHEESDQAAEEGEKRHVQKSGETTKTTVRVQKNSISLCSVALGEGNRDMQWHWEVLIKFSADNTVLPLPNVLFLFIPNW